MTARIVILAAGQGKRMGSPIPKVLIPLHGRPLISYLLDTVKKSGVDPRPAIVVSPQNEEDIRAAIGDDYEFVVQTERLGTGHAVACAKEALAGKCDAVIVLYGDMPFIKPTTIKNLLAEWQEHKPAIAMLTNVVPDFTGTYAPLADYGRVIRNAQGAIEGIVEVKDATPAQLRITEVNPSYFCFDSTWLWTTIDKLQNNNAQGEYYLVDLVRIATKSAQMVRALDASPLESIGVNTPEHLEHAHRVSMH